MGSHSSKGSQSLDPEVSSCLMLDHICVLSSHLAEFQGSESPICWTYRPWQASLQSPPLHSAFGLPGSSHACDQTWGDLWEEMYREVDVPLLFPFYSWKN